MFFGAQTLWSANNNNTFRGSGLHLDAANERFSFGSELWLNDNGVNLIATQQGAKTPPWLTPDPNAIVWQSSGGFEAGRITGYFEDTTPTVDDCRLGLSAGDGEGVIYFFSNTFSSQLNLKEDDSQALSGGGEKALTVNAETIGVNASSNERICRLDLGLGIANPLSASFTITIINTGSSQFFFRDQSAASLSGSNIKTAGAVDRELQRGSSIPVTFYRGTYYVGQDRT